MIFLLARNFASGGVSMIVIGARTGNSALLHRMASVRAPPVDAASSAVRLRFFASSPIARNQGWESTEASKSVSLSPSS
ncbi:hypothetical protein NL676_038355 [Syzygium grande]|nr:hypothetical protein NL676_038355 [Syzygium grande]